MVSPNKSDLTSKLSSEDAPPQQNLDLSHDDVLPEIKKVQDDIKCCLREIEDEICEKFSLLKIEQSKKCIELTREINVCWDNFLENLKTAEELQEASVFGDFLFNIMNSDPK